MKNLKTDVVIVGSGAGGLAAALTVAEGGAKVSIFEKNSFIGGISIYPGHIFAVESKLQRRYNIPFTRDDAFRIFMERTHWKGDARLVRAFIDKSASTIEWLEQHGVEFEIPPLFLSPEGKLTGHSVKLPGEFVGLLKILRSKAESLGAEILLSTPVKKLIKDGDRIVGVIVEDQSGETIRVDAKAVIIASGGYPNNKEMLKKYGGFELGRDLTLITKIELTGDGIQMAWEAGAASDGMGVALRYDPPTRSGYGGLGWDLVIITHQPHLWINQHGVRFFDEGVSFTGAYTGNAIARQKNRCAYAIFDGNTKRYLEEEILYMQPPVVGHPTASVTIDIDSLLRKYLDKGSKDILIADSLEELARKIEVNQSVLKATVDEYNGFCAKGHDDLFAKNPKYLRPVKQPKFYAFKILPMAYGTLGGIKINERTEVLNTEDEVIRGLYAVGDCANGAISYDFWLAHQLAGNPASFALNTGRIAAENALNYIGM